MSNEDGSGPAFPVDPQIGLSQRAYAAIHLRVPDSGLPWLDTMIERARRDEFAKAAMQGELSQTNILAKSMSPEDCELAFLDTAAFAQRVADAMLAQGRRDAEKLLPRPMSSAPKDQDGVLAYCPTFYQGRGGWVVAVWLSGGWHANPAGWLFAPTHWVPLPEKPVAQAIEKEAGL